MYLELCEIKLSILPKSKNTIYFHYIPTIQCGYGLQGNIQEGPNSDQFGLTSMLLLTQHLGFFKCFEMDYKIKYEHFKKLLFCKTILWNFFARKIFVWGCQKLKKI